METSVEVVCPYCGEVVSVVFEVGSAEHRYHEDCEVCCRPIHVDVRRELGDYTLQVRRSSGL